MTSRIGAAALLLLSAGTLVPLAPSRATESGNNASAGDNIVSLPDQPADDEELGKVNGTPPHSSGGATILPPAQDTDPIASAPTVDSGGLSTFSGDTSGIAVSTVSATISNNDFHN